MSIVLDTLTTMAILTDPTASMMLEIEKGIIVNSFPSAYVEEEKVASGEDILNINSMNMSALGIIETSLDASLFNTIENTDDINSPTVIVKDALEQMKNLNYIEVDDEIDRKIDAFFAERQSKKVKKTIYKRT